MERKRRPIDIYLGEKYKTHIIPKYLLQPFQNCLYNLIWYKKDWMVVPFPKPGLELFMEDLETSCLTSPELQLQLPSLFTLSATLPHTQTQ